VCTDADLRIQKTIQHNLKSLFPADKLICEEEDSSIDESEKPSMQPDQVLKIIRRQSILTPEILSVSQKLRKFEYERYLHELVQLNEREFLAAADV